MAGNLTNQLLALVKLTNQLTASNYYIDRFYLVYVTLFDVSLQRAGRVDGRNGSITQIPILTMPNDGKCSYLATRDERIQPYLVPLTQTSPIPSPT